MEGAKPKTRREKLVWLPFCKVQSQSYAINANQVGEVIDMIK